jgi:hypothetical protein
MKKFSLVIEGVEGPMADTWGVRVGQKMPGGQLHWICNWMPSYVLNDQTMDEQCQVICDAWTNLAYRLVGIQKQLF